MATTTTEKNAATATNVVEMMMDQSLKSLSTMCWAQEQGEKVVRTWMESNQTTREEGQKVAAKMAEAVKENQKQLQALVQNTVRMTLEAYKVPQAAMVEELQRQVAELQKQIEKMSAATK